jgi:hypothetical protein
MKKFVLLVISLAALFVSTASAQKEDRFEMTEAGVSFEQPAFLTPLTAGSSLFTADPAKYGKLAMFLFSPSVKLNVGSKAAGDELEKQLAIKDMQLRLAKNVVEGFDTGLFDSITVEKTELVTIDSLPTIRIFLNLKHGDDPYKCTALMFYSRKNDKAYYAGWLSTADRFADLTRDIQPAINSIQFK